MQNTDNLSIITMQWSDTFQILLLMNIVSLFVMFSTFLLQGIMLVYDITNEKSFENIRNWIRNIEEVSIHNKSDSSKLLYMTTYQ